MLMDGTHISTRSRWLVGFISHNHSYGIAPALYYILSGGPIWTQEENVFEQLVISAVGKEWGWLGWWHIFPTTAPSGLNSPEPLFSTELSADTKARTSLWSFIEMRKLRLPSRPIKWACLLQLKPEVICVPIKVRKVLR